jgi:hypothetical protein
MLFPSQLSSNLVVDAISLAVEVEEVAVACFDKHHTPLVGGGVIQVLLR